MHATQVAVEYQITPLHTYQIIKSRTSSMCCVTLIIGSHHPRSRHLMNVAPSCTDKYFNVILQTWCHTSWYSYTLKPTAYFSPNWKWTANEQKSTIVSMLIKVYNYASGFFLPHMQNQPLHAHIFLDNCPPHIRWEAFGEGYCVHVVWSLWISQGHCLYKNNSISPLHGSEVPH